MQSSMQFSVAVCCIWELVTKPCKQTFAKEETAESELVF